MTKTFEEKHPLARLLISDRALLAYIAILFCVTVVSAWNFTRTVSIEKSNRRIICQSREQRELNPPETAYERSMLAIARRDVTDCN